jgi:hypothetical protein
LEATAKLLGSSQESSQSKPVEAKEKEQAVPVENPVVEEVANDYPIEQPKPDDVSAPDNKSTEVPPGAYPQIQRFEDLVAAEFAEREWVDRIVEEGEAPERLLGMLKIEMSLGDGTKEDKAAEGRFIDNLAYQMEDAALEHEQRSLWDRFFTFNLFRKFNARRQLVGSASALGAIFSGRRANMVDERIATIRRNVGTYAERIGTEVNVGARAKKQYLFLAKWLKSA